MLLDAQQALADISASADWCSAIRLDPQRLDQRYTLTPRERRQVLAAANHPGMSLVCGLVRMNRLTPLMQNLPSLLTALGDSLQEVLLAYWAAHPFSYSHGYVECRRFCLWLGDRELSDPLRQVLSQEQLALEACIEAVHNDRT